MKYRVALTLEDFDACRVLMLAEHWPPQELGHPTVMVHHNDELLGFLSTEIQDGLIIAGPLVVRQDRPRAVVVLDLMHAYEEILQSLGIHRYIFWADSVKTPGFVRGLKKYLPNMKPYAVQGTKEFYVRVLDGSQEAMVS